MKYFFLFLIGVFIGHLDAKYGYNIGYSLGVWTKNIFAGVK